MTKNTFYIALFLIGCSTQAAANTPKEQYAQETRIAAARYADDRKMCADENNEARRMQCLRDAKAENGRALAAAKASLKAASGGKLPCLDCGKVVAVTVSQKAGESNALGLIGGGLAGALLGHQVGGGSGKDVATVAGAVGGAYAGKKIQEKANASQVWNVEVQYDNGTRNNFKFERDPQLKAGDRVRNAGPSIARD
ncbi:MAG: glycine zipper 2TM domain-containing protein [Pseudomonadota bacterium]